MIFDRFPKKCFNFSIPLPQDTLIEPNPLPSEKFIHLSKKLTANTISFHGKARRLLIMFGTKFNFVH